MTKCHGESIDFLKKKVVRVRGGAGTCSIIPGYTTHLFVLLIYFYFTPPPEVLPLYCC